MKNMYCFKMTNGEEVIGKAELPDNWFMENSLDVENAISFVPTQQGIGAAPWPNAGDNTLVTINVQNCIAITKVRSEVENMYIQSTSGIEIVSSNDPPSPFA